MVQEAIDWLLRVIAEFWVMSILSIVGGVVLAVLKAKWPKFGGIVLTGIAGAALIFGILLGMRFDQYLRLQQPIANDENVDRLVRDWIDNFGLGYQRAPDNQIGEQTFFAVRITLPNTLPIIVYRTHQSPKYLQFMGAIVITGNSQQQLARLSEQQLLMLHDEVLADLSRGGFASNVPPDMKRVDVVSRVPIGPALNEHEFMQAVERMSIGQTLARESIVLTLNRITRPGTN